MLPTKQNGYSSWHEKEQEEQDEGYPITEYDIMSSPNDFNVKTLFDMIEKGIIEIPGFQRNYVWDIKRASKLIESLIIGLPIPQIFLYEKDRNKFVLIDGQQRLMTIYYFMQGRFPRIEKRTELRQMFNLQGGIPDEILANDEHFTDFQLDLPEKLPEKRNRYNKRTYGDLGEVGTTFELRTIRSIMIKQISPKNNNAMYEIFHRLNAGGLNLSPQEIRMSLYHSDFYDMLYEANTKPKWRDILGGIEPDLHMKDIEFILRGFALLVNEGEYKPSMVKFLNKFSQQSQQCSPEQVKYFEKLFDSFLKSCELLAPNAFQRKGRFSFMLFEAVFVAVCREPYKSQSPVIGNIAPESLDELKTDSDFLGAAQKGTASKENVRIRLQRASQIVRVA